MQLAAFLEFLKDRAGESLRAVEWYRGDDAEFIYLRDDLELADVQSRAGEIHELLTDEGPKHSTPELRKLGNKQATLNLYEKAVLLNLPMGENYGVVVGLDPEVARSLHRFVGDCRARLEEQGEGSDAA